MESETFNKFMVGLSGAGIVLLNPPRGPISNDEAIVLASWLLALAGDFDCAKAKQIIAAMD